MMKELEKEWACIAFMLVAIGGMVFGGVNYVRDVNAAGISPLDWEAGKKVYYECEFQKMEKFGDSVGNLWNDYISYCKEVAP